MPAPPAALPATSGAVGGAGSGRGPPPGRDRPFKFAVPGGGHVMVVLARSPGCPSRHEPARSQGLPIPADNFPNELARVCDSVGKPRAWRGLGAAFPSHFIMGRKIHCMEHGARSCARPGGQSCWAVMPEITARLMHGRRRLSPSVADG